MINYNLAKIVIEFHYYIAFRSAIMEICSILTKSWVIYYQKTMYEI